MNFPMRGHKNSFVGTGAPRKRDKSRYIEQNRSTFISKAAVHVPMPPAVVHTARHYSLVMILSVDFTSRVRHLNGYTINFCLAQPILELTQVCSLYPNLVQNISAHTVSFEKLSLSHNEPRIKVLNKDLN